ncbi:MAG: IS66 family transposase [Candidatus Methylomirabilis sp.]
MEPTKEQWYLRRIAELEAEVARLAEQVAKLSKNSSNSSKPPSSDIVKPPKPPIPHGRRKRRIGGQAGHSRHEREAFSPEQIDEVRPYTLDCCPDCGGKLKRVTNRGRVIPQVEIVCQPVEIVEHRAPGYWCPHGQKTHEAPLPAEVVKGGLIGPNLTALVAYLKGVCHASFSTVRKFLRDVVGVTISRGQLAKLIRKVSEALAGPYQALLGALPVQRRLNVDETGHKDNGDLWWTWCFRAEMFTLFKIEPSRGSQVLLKVLGEEFNGVLGCDYFSAYRKYMEDCSIAVQFCLAHLIREVKFLLTLPDRVTRNYGERLRDKLRQLFRVIHRREEMTPEQFQRALERSRKALLKVGRRAPQRRATRNLAARFRKHGEAYFQFITTPGVEPTNNLAEQAIRFVVIDRRVTQGTRSEAGRQWNERIWTTITTLTQQGRSILAYLRDTICAYFNNQPAPALFPSGP